MTVTEDVERCKFSRYCYVVTVGNCYCVSIIFILSVLELKGADWICMWYCGFQCVELYPHVHMDFISKVLSLRDIGIFTAQELVSVGYRKPEKMF